MTSLLLRSFVATCLCSYLSGCGSSPARTSNAAEGRFQYAQELAKNERYEEAIQEFQEVKNKHPYSRFAVEAELEIANLFFKRESFIEAQSAYEVFKSLHPQHPQTDLVTFRIGLSFFNQLPSSIDRDLSLAKKAITHFEEVTRKFPQSTYVQEAVEKRLSAQSMLVEKEFYIADFYLKKKKYKSALSRYERVIDAPPGKLKDRALYGATVCAVLAGVQEKGKKYFAALTEEFPDSPYAKTIRDERGKYGL